MERKRHKEICVKLDITIIKQIVSRCLYISNTLWHFLFLKLFQSPFCSEEALPDVSEKVNMSKKQNINNEGAVSSLDLKRMCMQVIQGTNKRSVLGTEGSNPNSK